MSYEFGFQPYTCACDHARAHELYEAEIALVHLVRAEGICSRLMRAKFYRVSPHLLLLFNCWQEFTSIVNHLRGGKVRKLDLYWFIIELLFFHLGAVSVNDLQKLIHATLVYVHECPRT